MAAPPRPVALAKPTVAVRINSEHRDRVIKLLAENVEGIGLTAQSPRRRPERQRGEVTLFFSASEAFLAAVKPKGEPAYVDTRDAWHCSKCTFLNTNPTGLFCEMCNSPRNITEWSGFNQQKPDPRLVRARLALAFKVCATTVTVLATSGVANRAFETGGVLMLTHAALSWGAFFRTFAQEVHGDEEPPKRRIRVRCKPTMRDRLISEYMSTGEGSTPGCRLDPNPDTYTHVFGAMEIGLDTADDLGVKISSKFDNTSSTAAPADSDAPPPADGASAVPPPEPSSPEMFLFGLVPRMNDYASIAPNNKPDPPVARVCRAYHKIEELAKVSPLVSQTLARARVESSKSCALDIGAAPGGWTAYLADHFDTVLAVDPAALDPDVLKRDAVRHIPMKLQAPSSSGASRKGSEEVPETEAVAEAGADIAGVTGEIDENGAAEDSNHDCTPECTVSESNSSSTKLGKPRQDAYDAIRKECGQSNFPTLVCCDINHTPAEAVQICLRALPVVAPGSVFAVTMKLNRRGVAGNKELLQEAVQLLDPFCEDIEEHWLFANTYHERTIVGQLRLPSDPGAIFSVVRCPAEDTKPWGAALWRKMHSHCASLPEKLSTDERHLLMEFLKDIHREIPCELCAQHWVATFITMDADFFDLTATRNQAFQMLYDIHSIWNLCLGQAFYPWRQALADYGMPVPTAYEPTKLMYLIQNSRRVPHQGPNMYHSIVPK